MNSHVHDKRMIDVKIGGGRETPDNGIKNGNKDAKLIATKNNSILGIGAIGDGGTLINENEKSTIKFGKVNGKGGTAKAKANANTNRILGIGAIGDNQGVMNKGSSVEFGDIEL